MEDSMTLSLQDIEDGVAALKGVETYLDRSPMTAASVGMVGMKCSPSL
jgi:hypothetical protein